MSDQKKTAPAITAVSGKGIKSYGVEINNNTILIPVVPGTDINALAPEFSFEAAATATLTKGTYANGTITVTDAEDPTLTAEWTITTAERGNAVLDGFYADPNITCFNGKYYIYPTTDGGTGWDAPYFKCFSSDDLVNWTDEGVILDLADVSWSNGKNGWAPTIAEKNGKYYFYYSAAPKDNGPKNLAVAVSDSPTGPFVDKGIIAKGGELYGQMIDPGAFVDDDGQGYLYWGNSALYGAKLSDDMLSIQQDTLTVMTPPNFREASFVIKRKGKYYIMWSEDDTGSPNYHVRYGTMDTPLGPINGNTVVLHRDNADADIIKGTGHHSVLNIPGTDDWYICYHRFNTVLFGHQETQCSAAGNHREVCIDKMEFDENGNITRAVPTLEGITSPVYPKKKTSENDMAAYLFVHFVGTESSADSEQIYFSVSKDGQSWKTLNKHSPILTSTLGEKGLRDPHIVRSPDGDKFFIVATDLSIYHRRDDENRWGSCQTAGSKAIMVWESHDLVTWSEQRMIEVAPHDAGCTWAPESIYDAEKGQYMVFWASKVGADNYATQRIYRCYTADFKHFSAPEVYIDDGNISNIDTTFIYHDGVYYRFTKNESKSSVTMMKSNSLSGEFCEVDTYTINGVAGNTVTGYEGPTAYKLNGEDKWCLLLDFYSCSQGYKPFVTDDITKGEFTSASDFTFETTFRHGTVMPITLDEYNALVKAYPTK